MTITAMTGLPGGGKSYGAVAHQVLPALRAGRRVVTNLPLVRDEVRKITNKGEIVEFPTEEVLEDPERLFEYVTPGSVFILDEVWKIWPAGQKVNQVPQPFKHLIAEHRHMMDGSGRSVSIVLVTQDLADIGTFARNKVATTLHHVKMDHMGAPNRFRVDVYRGSVTGSEPPEGRKLRTIYGTYKAEVYRCYKSHTMATGEVRHVDEAGLDRRHVIWKRPMIWAGLLFAIAAPVWAVSTLYDLFFAPPAVALAASVASVERTAEAPAEKRPEPIAPPIAERVQATVQAPARRLPSYRVAGVVRSGDERPTGYAMIESSGRHVSVPLSSCWFEGDGLTRCSFDGFVVTELGVSHDAL